jgi:uncharacterized protein
MSETNAAAQPTPWWRVPAMWLVVGCPTFIVVAGIATGIVAFRLADTPIREAAEKHAPSQTPAHQARNHAAAPRQ